MLHEKLNTATAGFHMLMLLAEVDDDIHTNEGKLIIEYIEEQFPIPVNFDKHIEFLSTLNKQDYFNHFCKVMDDFYEDSTEKERSHFIDFVVRMIKADDIITKEENIYLNTLFGAWNPEQE